MDRHGVIGHGCTGAPKRYRQPRTGGMKALRQAWGLAVALQPAGLGVSGACLLTGFSTPPLRSGGWVTGAGAPLSLTPTGTPSLERPPGPRGDHLATSEGAPARRRSDERLARLFRRPGTKGRRGERGALPAGAGDPGFSRWQHRAGDRPAGADLGGPGPGDDPPVQRDGDGVAGPSSGRVAVPAGSRLDDEAFIVETAGTRPEKLGMPFTHWSIRKLRDYLAGEAVHRVKIGRERLRQILERHEITFQRTKTWKESNDPLRDAKLARIEEVTTDFPDRCFAFDEFGPLAVHPVGGCCWAQRKHPQRLRANYHKTCGVRQFHGCYSYADDTIWGVVRRQKGSKNTLEAIRSCRVARPDGEPIYLILDNLSAHKNKDIRKWCSGHNVELCFTPTYSSWANPIEAHFGPLREFVLNNSNHPNHVVLTRRLHAYLRWRNANARDPKILEAQRKKRRQMRAEKQRRWGRPAPRAA